VTEQTQALARQNGDATAFPAIPLEADTARLALAMAKSGYFSDVKDAAQAVVKILAGKELGFGPVASMTGVYIVQGKVTLSANLMAAAIKRTSRYTYRVRQLDDAACSIAFYEGGEEVGVSTFTIEDAKKAKLAGKDIWQGYARNMLFARALSNGARWYTPDIFGGPVYTPEEMGADVDGDGNVKRLPPVNEGEYRELPAGDHSQIEQSTRDAMERAQNVEVPASRQAPSHVEGYAGQGFAERTGADPSMEGPAPERPEPAAPKPIAPDVDDLDGAFEQLESKADSTRNDPLWRQFVAIRDAAAKVDVTSEILPAAPDQVIQDEIARLKRAVGAKGGAVR
jgi:hypothetical protein